MANISTANANSVIDMSDPLPVDFKTGESVRLVNYLAAHVLADLAAEDFIL